MIVEGSFEQGKPQQKSSAFKIRYPNGEIYEGAWVREQMQGQGNYTYEDGSQYIGSWHMNQRHGKGKMTFKK